jgi:hypothetical protein
MVENATEHCFSVAPIAFPAPPTNPLKLPTSRKQNSTKKPGWFPVAQFRSVAPLAPTTNHEQKVMKFSRRILSARKNLSKTQPSKEAGTGH